MRVKHDLHIHTNLSLCADRDVTVAYYIDKARELGLRKIGFTNHMWDEKIQPVLNEFYEIQTVEHNLKLRGELKAVEKKELEVLFGAEAEFHPLYGVALTEENAEQFDYILVSNSHTHMTMEKSLYEPHQRHVEFMVEAYRKILNSPVRHHILAIAHPFEAVCCPYDRQSLYEMISDDTYKDLFASTAEKEIAVEINVGCFPGITSENCERFGAMRMFRIAHDMGCKFTFGSDAHSRKAHDGYVEEAQVFIDYLGITEKDIAEMAR